jgi:hypothetical protein
MRFVNVRSLTCHHTTMCLTSQHLGVTNEHNNNDNGWTSDFDIRD